MEKEEINKLGDIKEEINTAESDVIQEENTSEKNDLNSETKEQLDINDNNEELKENLYDLEIDPEFENLLPKLGTEQYELLEKDIVANGCLSPIILWENKIVDGHHRFKICKDNNIKFEIKEMHFDSKVDAMMWALETQRARRNMKENDLLELIAKFKGPLEEEAKKRQRLSEGRGKTKDNQTDNNFEQVHVDEKLAAIAGVSRSTINKAKKVEKDGPEKVKEAYMEGQISISCANEITKELENVAKEDRETKAEELIEAKKNKKIQETSKTDEIKLFKSLQDIINIKNDEINNWVDNVREEEIKQNIESINNAIQKLKEILDILMKLENKENIETG